MATVTMRDGAVVEMPDQLDPALGARLRAFQTAQAPKPPANANTDPNFDEHSPLSDVASMVKAIPSGVMQMLQGIGNNATEHPILGNLPAIVDTFRRIAADPGGTLTSALAAVRNATPEQVGRNVAAPLVAGAGATGLVRGATGLVSGAAAADAATDAGQLGFRTASGPGAELAGKTAGPALDIQNQRVAQSVLGADAGVPHTSPVNASTLETAREAPGRVIDAGYDQVQPGPLSPAANQQVLAARGAPTITKPTPNVANAINDIESSLTDPQGQFTGPQLRATRNSLNSDAQAGAGSDDADTRAIAAYKRRVVSALDQHVVDSTPPGAPVTADQLQNARSTLAKNYTLQDLIGKGGDIDLQKLAAMHRDSPNLFTGPTRTVAQFASDHPEVTGSISDANRISPPSVLGDVSKISLADPRSWVQPALGIAGRRLLTGPRGEAIGRAMQSPVTGLGGEFDIKPPTDLPMSPPPGNTGGPAQHSLPLGAGSGRVSFPTGGMTASPPSAPAAPPAGAPGQISLADLLSHGVEQSPSSGLSLAPMGAPEPQGLPFTQSAEHMAGGLETASPEDWLNKFLSSENNSDVAGVRSQGVPDGTMTRAANNASGESAASQEAINRGTKQLAIIDQDGNEQPLLRDVTQADSRAPKGKMIINTSTGEIVDRGGMSQARAEGLRNRWATMGRTLGDHFTTGPAGG